VNANVYIYPTLVKRAARNMMNKTLKEDQKGSALGAKKSVVLIPYSALAGGGKKKREHGLRDVYAPIEQTIRKNSSISFKVTIQPRITSERQTRTHGGRSNDSHLRFST